MALAANVSPDHAFLMFERQTLDPELDFGYRLNIANEYRAFGGELLLTEVPTFQRMLWRFGLLPGLAYAAYADDLAWWPYLKQQAASIGGMSLPFLAAGKADQSSVWLMAVGASACAAVSIAARRRPLLVVLAVSGLFWALPMRHFVVFHDFQSLFYLGIPLVAWSAALSHLLGASSPRRAVAVAVTLVVFIGSTVRISGVGQDPARADLQAEVIADFEAIRPLTAGKDIFVPKSPRSLEIATAAHAIDYYLAGSRIDYKNKADRRPLADFILTNRRKPGKEDALLTPDTRRVFLYDRVALDGAGRLTDARRRGSAHDPPRGTGGGGSLCRDERTGPAHPLRPVRDGVLVRAGEGSMYAGGCQAAVLRAHNADARVGLR